MRLEEKELIFDLSRHVLAEGVLPFECACGGEARLHGVLPLAEPWERMNRLQIKNADGSHATVHREWAMAKSGLFLAPPRNFQSITEGKVEICKDEHSFLSTVKLLVLLPYEQEEIVIRPRMVSKGHC